jgi:histidine triad (HIT) family protein
VDQCEFCQIVAGHSPATKVFEDVDTLAFFPTRPVTLGHTLLVPKVHVPHIWELTNAVALPLMKAMLLLSKALREAVDPHGLNVINSAGEAASQTVFHLHIHLVPRWEGDALGDIWPRDRTWSEHDKATAAALIRKSLANEIGG